MFSSQIKTYIEVGKFIKHLKKSKILETDIEAFVAFLNNVCSHWQHSSQRGNDSRLNIGGNCKALVIMDRIFTQTVK